MFVTHSGSCNTLIQIGGRPTRRYLQVFENKPPSSFLAWLAYADTLNPLRHFHYFLFHLFNRPLALLSQNQVFL